MVAVRVWVKRLKTTGQYENFEAGFDETWEVSPARAKNMRRQLAAEFIEEVILAEKTYSRKLQEMNEELRKEALRLRLQTNIERGRCPDCNIQMPREVPAPAEGMSSMEAEHQTPVVKWGPCENCGWIPPPGWPNLPEATK